MTVSLFNSLAPSPSEGQDDWFLDLRYIPVEPPFHILFLSQRATDSFYAEQIPLDVWAAARNAPDPSSGLQFFPELAREAAPHVARALVHMFTSPDTPTFNCHDKPDLRKLRKLYTLDAELSDAVSDCFREMGVGTHLASVAHLQSTGVRQTRLCMKWFHSMRQARYEHDPGLRDIPSIEAIAFTSFCPPPDQRHDLPLDTPEGRVNRTLRYTEDWVNSRPLVSGQEDECVDVSKLLPQFLDAIAKSATPLLFIEADRGNPADALELGLRCSLSFVFLPATHQLVSDFEMGHTAKRIASSAVTTS